MYTMRAYVQAESPEQAAALLRENQRNVILGGNISLIVITAGLYALFLVNEKKKKTKEVK